MKNLNKANIVAFILLVRAFAFIIISYVIYCTFIFYIMFLNGNILMANISLFFCTYIVI